MQHLINHLSGVFVPLFQKLISTHKESYFNNYNQSKHQNGRSVSLNVIKLRKNLY